MMNKCFGAALLLHGYMVQDHWNGQALLGPDPGVRFNYRIGRFVKSYLPNLHWNDDLYYIQGQGYWILGNLTLFAKTGATLYRDIAVACATYMLQRQREDGAWDYPNPEWKGRVATVEGTWGAIGLLELFRQTGDQKYLAGALHWHEYLIYKIGFRQQNGELAINYFSKPSPQRVPNNSILVLRFLAELIQITGDLRYKEPVAGLLKFIHNVQKENGEFPYFVGEATDFSDGRPHFQCYQYNAFECLDLIRYYELTGDHTIVPVITKVVDFLSGGLADDGHLLYQCGNQYRAVTYHAAAFGAALTKASRLNLPGCENLAKRGYEYVLHLQRADGSIPYSQHDYRLLSDQRSYPRYLAMILCHLLVEKKES